MRATSLPLILSFAAVTLVPFAASAEELGATVQMQVPAPPVVVVTPAPPVQPPPAIIFETPVQRPANETWYRPEPAVPQTKMRSKGLVIGGSILTAAGIGMAVGGGAYLASLKRTVFLHQPCPSDLGGLGCAIGQGLGNAFSEMDYSLGQAFGGLLLAAGIGSTIGGLAMIGVGAQDAPIKPKRYGAFNLTMPQLSVGPSGATLRMMF